MTNTLIDAKALEAARTAIIGNPMNLDQIERIVTAYIEALSPEAQEPVASEIAAWVREVDINGPCLVFPVFLHERDVAMFKSQPGNKDAVFRPLYAAPPAQVVMTDVAIEKAAVAIEAQVGAFAHMSRGFYQKLARTALTAALSGEPK